MANLADTKDTFLTRKQVLELLDISEVTLWRRCNDGSIKKTMLGRRVYFKHSDLLNMGTAVPEPVSKAA